MNIKMNTSSQNFNGLIRYTNQELKVESTIDTQNIVDIKQRYNNEYSDSPYYTDIIVKNLFANKDKDKYITYSFRMPIDDVVMQYNRACRNENADLGIVRNIISC